jgi:ureidoacrylate peracid hydrolase
MAERRVLASLDERLSPARTAVIVVDMQNDYVSEGGAEHRRAGSVASSQAIIPTLGALLQAARAAGVLVIYAKMTFDYARLRYFSEVEWAKRLHRYGTEPMLVPGTWGHQVAPAIVPQPGDLEVEKHRSSAFVGTDLDLILRSNRVESVVVTGIVTQGCVLATALSASMNDYYVTIPSDCVASPTPDLHDATLALLRGSLVLEDSILPSARIIDAWAALRTSQEAEAVSEAATATRR